MTEQLKHFTHQSHQALEGFLIPVIKDTCTVAEYIRLLTMFYGYYKPVEDAISVFPVSDDLPDYTQRRKAQLILHDIHSLGDDTDNIRCTTGPVLSSINHAFGALYVLEGSTLGGQIITRILQRNLNCTGDNGFSFFAGYGAETGLKWTLFLQVLSRYCAHAESFREVSAAANQTFIQLQKWAKQHTGMNVQKKNYDSAFCGNLPVHHLNVVQPHGVLVVLNKHNKEIVQVSENIVQLLGIPAQDIVHTSFSAYADEPGFNLLGRRFQKDIQGKIPLNLFLHHGR